MGDDSPAEKKALIDYNVGVFQTALKQVFPRAEREPPGQHQRYDGVDFGHDEPVAGDGR